MGRWIVIISLAMAQCPGLAGAEPPATGIPLPKPRPVHRDPPSAAVKTLVAPPTAEPVVESAIEELPTDESPVNNSPVQSSLAPVEAPGVQAPAPANPTTANGDCNGGKRMRSTFYWQGSRTASGESFNPQGMTAAHRTLPFGTRLTVSNPRTGKSVTVIVNDRGPFVSGINIDLSLGAAQAIGMRGAGTVCIQ
jgi:rare lipoprotein A